MSGNYIVVVTGRDQNGHLRSVREKELAQLVDFAWCQDGDVLGQSSTAKDDPLLHVSTKSNH